MPTHQGDATLPLIYTAMAAWEGVELVNAAITGAGQLVAFPYFPTKADVASGLVYPYTVHGCEATTFQRLSVSNIPSVEMWNSHTIWAALIFGDEGDPLAALSERDARWREAYLEGFVKHLQLMAGGIALVASMTLLGAVPIAFDLFGRQEVGVRFNILAESRRTLPTAL